MKKHFLKKHEENWLRIPYEENADPCIITISDSTGKKETIQMKVSKTRVDYWMAYPLKDFFRGRYSGRRSGEQMDQCNRTF